MSRPMLSTPEVRAGEEQAADLAGIAFRLMRATGFYRAPSNGGSVISMAFGAVAITEADGTQRHFAIGVDDGRE